MKHKVKREAFTLIELLIVIVVIGVLAAMMIMSSSEIISTAKASNIIANLRNLKTAALSWYMDSFDHVQNINVGRIQFNKYRSNDPNNYWSYIKRYISNSSHQELDMYYSLVTSSQLQSNGSGENVDNGAWFVVYANEKLEDRVKHKLKGRAKSAQLLRAALPGTYPYGTMSNGRDNKDFKSDKGQWVFMQVK